MRALATATLLLLSACTANSPELRIHNASSVEQVVQAAGTIPLRIAPGGTATLVLETPPRDGASLEVRSPSGPRRIRLSTADLDLLGWRVTLP
jgi:hypothetical protein